MMTCLRSVAKHEPVGCPGSAFEVVDFDALKGCPVLAEFNKAGHFTSPVDHRCKSGGDYEERKTILNHDAKSD
jgi:hypothetical protein